MPHSSNSIKIIFVLAVLLIAAAGAFGRVSVSARASGQDLPAGKGVEIVRDKCVSCHEADLIVSQRLSKPGWVREVDKMIRWGATITDPEKETLVDYLATHFPQAPSIAKETNIAGKEIFESKCTVCHEADLTVQQRLTLAGWTREIEKMVRWGATVTDDEKRVLANYLFQVYGR